MSPHLSNYRIALVLLVLAMVVVPVPAHAQAQPLCVAIEATVENVFDSGGYLNGLVSEGDVITGMYIYDLTTPDTNSLVEVGDYWHTAAPFGITVSTARGLTFSTDQHRVNFLVEIINNYYELDNYLLRSYTNVYDVSAPSADPYANHISWQLDDPTQSALSSTALPTTPPVLADWQPIFGLEIASLDYGSGFSIRAQVTSATLCSDSDKKAQVCHKPGTPAARTLLVGRKALSAHLRHGDTQGTCP